MYYIPDILLFCRPVTAQDQMTSGLIKVGSQAALSFAFAFLRRAWRSGDDTDLCCELLQECTDTIRYELQLTPNLVSVCSTLDICVSAK